MQASEATLQAAWNQVVAHFPFPGYLDKLPHGHIGVARTVSRYLPAGSRVLDFGAGPADKTAMLAQLGYNCTAIDDLQDDWHKRGQARQMILDFADKMGVEFIVSDGQGIPNTAHDFDMVMLHDILEHLHDSPRNLVVPLLERVQTGGYLFATMPNHANLRKRLAVLRGKTALPQYEQYYWYPGHFRGHVREYTRGDCISLAKALGLEVVEVRGVHHMLDKVPRKLLPLYLAVSRMMPSTRDTWSLVLRKPAGWVPKLELDHHEFQKITGLKSWSEMAH
jgi:2-polyprenyl-3-methyl-5-hydroxy-6-metoxy-1,4-benzoquinol methylase